MESEEAYNIISQYWDAEKQARKEEYLTSVNESVAAVIGQVK